MAGALGQAPAWGLTLSPELPDNYEFTTNWLSKVDSLESNLPFNPSLRTNLLWFGASEPNIGFEAQVGPTFSVGVNLGLKVWPRWAPWDWDESGMNRHWRIEAEAGISGGLAAYDRYDCPHCGTRINSEHRAAFVPKLGVNIAWNPGSNNQYVWHIPRGHLSASVTLTPREDRYIRITTLYIKSMNGSVYKDGIVVP